MVKAVLNAVCSVLVSAIAVSICQGQGPDELNEIEIVDAESGEALKLGFASRENDTKTFRAVWDEVVEQYPSPRRKEIEEKLAAAKRPEERRMFENELSLMTAKKVRLHVRRELVASGNRFRFAIDGNDHNGAYRQVHILSDCSITFIERSEGGKTSRSGFVSDRKGPDIVLESAHARPLILAYRGGSFLAGRNGTLMSTFFAHSARGFLVAGEQRSRATLNISYRRNEHGWQPDYWVTTHYLQDGSVESVTKAFVRELVLNEPIDEAAFVFEFPPDTEVRDFREH